MPSDERLASTPPKEILVGSLRGFRWWRFKGDGQLRSPWRRITWQPGMNEARCLRRKRWFRWVEADGHPTGSPSLRCLCGFHALLSPPDADREALMMWDLQLATSGGPRGIVFGAVEGTGRALLGTEGWRAERARVTALYVARHLPIAPGLGAASERYGVPVYRDLRSMLGEWGPDLTDRCMTAAI